MWTEHGEYMYEVMVDGWYMYIKVEVYVAYIHCEIIQQKKDSNATPFSLSCCNKKRYANNRCNLDRTHF